MTTGNGRHESAQQPHRRARVSTVEFFHTGAQTVFRAGQVHDPVLIATARAELHDNGARRRDIFTG